MKWVIGICLVGVLAGCRREESRVSTVPADTVQVQEVGMPADSAAPEPLPSAGFDAQEEAFLRRLEATMAVVRDSLDREARRIGSLASLHSRDSAVVDLDRRWYGLLNDQVQPFLLESVFLSRMWIDSLKGSDTAFEHRVRALLESGAKTWDYDEGFNVVSDLGAREELFRPLVSPALAERLFLMHLETKTEIYNDAGFVAPLDTFVGRIQGWEAYARKHAATSHAAWADSTSSRYLYNLVCGSPNTRPFEKGEPDPEFFAAWKRLAGGPDGRSGRFMRQWLAVLDSEKGRLTPKAKAWLGERGYSPEEFE